ncbi:MAG TPA: MBL fold metallo-hydrolase [Methanoregula sp.]|nr:MBL fold metallo-hydrolase [Methanoregula sp.]
MLFQRIVSEGLAHNSYLVGSGGKAAVIDPRRDFAIYLRVANENGLAITHIFETHRNEDYVIGSTGLARNCGAGIFHGPGPVFSYGSSVAEGDAFTLGSLLLEIRQTPGHTEESISVVVTDREVSDRPFLVFCGDTLFAGDIARTDFYGPARKAEMAEKIYDSITRTILTLGDGTVICPAHGAGSVCGETIADHPFTTAGYEKQTNPLLLMGREAFIARRAAESPYFPPYFHTMEELNSRGAPSPCDLPHPRPLAVAEINSLRKSGCQIVDIRSPTGFAAGHIPGSLSIWRNGLASFMGWFLDYDRPTVVVDDFDLDFGEVRRQFIRLGYDKLEGWLAGGFLAWVKAAQEIASFPACSAARLKERMAGEDLFILDVRDIRNREKEGFIPGSFHRYIGELPHHLDEVPRDRPVITYCDAGYKGSLAAGILTADGYRDVANLLGGMAGWKHAGYPVGHG